MARRGTRRTVAVGLLLMLIAAGCSKATVKETVKQPDTVPGGTLRIGATEPLGFNRMTTKNVGAATATIVENTFFYSSKATPDFGLVYPGLEQAPTLKSQNPQVVEWKIKKEARWSDGSPVTSEDLRYFYQQVTDPNRDVVSRHGYEDVEKLVVVNDKTIEATFKTPYPDYTDMFNDVPNAAFMKAQPGGWDTGLKDNPGPSAGPFVFKEWIKGQSLTLERNPQWWGPGRPLDALVFVFLADLAAQVKSLANGTLDMVVGPAQRDVVEDAKGVLGARVQIDAGPSWEQLTFNVRNPILSSPKVRQAIAHAIDRNAIVALLKPFAEKAAPLGNFLYVSNHPLYESHDRDYQTADLTLAGKLLDEEGWVRGTDGIREKGGQKLALRLATTSGNPVREDTQELVRRQLEKLGVEVRIDNCSSSCLLSGKAPMGDFDLAIFAWRGSVYAVSDVKALYKSDSQQNYGKLAAPQFDALAALATSTFDPEARRKMGVQLDQLLWTELPALPLFQRPIMLAVRDQFVGITNNTTTDGPFWNSNEFAMKAPRR